MDEVLVERRGAVGVITLNRPAKLNALNTPMMEGLEHALKELDDDPEISAIVLTGAGERAFSAGRRHGRAGRGHRGQAAGAARFRLGWSADLSNAHAGRHSRLLLRWGGAAGNQLRHSHQWRGRSLQVPRSELRSGAGRGDPAADRRRGQGQRAVVHGRRRAGRRGAAHRTGQPRGAVGGGARLQRGHGRAHRGELATRGPGDQGHDRAGAAGRAGAGVRESDESRHRPHGGQRGPLPQGGRPDYSFRRTNKPGRWQSILKTQQAAGVRRSAPSSRPATAPGRPAGSNCYAPRGPRP